jgi:CheY-like chemotaxis protein
MRLGDMSGAEVSERLRDDPATAALPIIVVTSQRLTSDDERRLGSDCPVLSKSGLTRDALRAAIRQAVSTTAATNGPL